MLKRVLKKLEYILKFVIANFMVTSQIKRFEIGKI